KGVSLEAHAVRNKSLSEIETTSRLLPTFNTSAINLARSLSSFLNGTELSFTTIQTRVAPSLFLVLSTIPHVSLVSYTGIDGLLFSYYKNEDQLFAVYSNTSFSPYCYTQPVNRDTGNIYGDAVASKSMVSVNSSWFQQSLNSTGVYSSLGTGWDGAQNSMFLYTVAMDGRGLITLGFPAKGVIEHFAALDFHGGHFHLATADGNVIMQTTLPNAQILVYNNTVSVQTLKPNGDLGVHSNNYSCKSDDNNFVFFNLKIMGIRHKFYCSCLQITGIPTVYVLAYSRNHLVDLVHRNSKLSLALLVLMFVTIFISLGTFIFLIARAAKREMFLCASLIKQMNATEQAERKSMNKSKAFANANHDVRGSLAAITGLIDLCHQNANPKSEIEENLVQMKTCTKDLLVILNSVLEMSRIEAGKVDLEEEEFNMAQLLQDVVDLFYPVGMKKGIDVVLDCDESILKASLVRGDRVKLKQILSNLVNNAIKFTSEGHVSVRGVIKKRSFENDIIASNQNVLLKCLSRMFYKNKEGFNDLDALRTVKQNPHLTEFEFEVDDTGRGIPKDKQASIFEDFCQVKETALEQEGSGLGLGIVQSLVRLMHGEIRIVEKEPGERGCRFKFNIFLTACEPELADSDEESPRMNNDNGFHQHFQLFRAPSPKPDGSHVVLLILGDERKRVLKKCIENLNIKVTIMKQGKNLHQELERIKRKLDSPRHSHSGKPESSSVEYKSRSGSVDYGSGGNDGHLIIKDGNEHVLPHFKKSNSRSLSGFTILVIDTDAGEFSELSSAVANFRKDIPGSIYKVVWLCNPFKRNGDEERLALPCDCVVNKPLHGSRLYQVIGLLRKETSMNNIMKLKIGATAQEVQNSLESNCPVVEAPKPSNSQDNSPQKIVMHAGDEKNLNGKKILLVEDFEIMCMLTTASLRKLGANVEVCKNGKEAVDQMCKVFSVLREMGYSTPLPYDYILMDCEMPIMNGFEATRLIRMEAERYDFHIPIIGLTGHTTPEETRKIVEAGMDFHLTKPLDVKKLLEVIQSIDGKQV
ncbi:Response_reg domain-containing protein/HisKA domain-containing protein/HATPase_c domain-containing protein, partial [Cephalotus follicularis]